MLKRTPRARYSFSITMGIVAFSALSILPMLVPNLAYARTCCMHVQDGDNNWNNPNSVTAHILGRRVWDWTETCRTDNDIPGVTWVNECPVPKNYVMSDPYLRAWAVDTCGLTLGPVQNAPGMTIDTQSLGSIHYSSPALHPTCNLDGDGHVGHHSAYRGNTDFHGKYTLIKFRDATNDIVENCIVGQLCNNNSGKVFGCGFVGNPCDPGSGNKYQNETDYKSANDLLNITRSYNSLQTLDFGFGVGWSSSLLKTLGVQSHQLTHWSNRGRGEVWMESNGVYSGDADSDLIVTSSGSNLLVTHANGNVETYSSSGKLMSETRANGTQVTYQYVSSSSRLIRQISDSFGNTLDLTYNSAGRIVSITDSSDRNYRYSYSPGGNLTRVIYPDNTTRQYHYENNNFLNGLTGITDENGDRYATFTYDSQGRAISTEHADVGSGVQEKYSIDYTQ